MSLQHLEAYQKYCHAKNANSSSWFLQESKSLLLFVITGAHGYVGKRKLSICLTQGEVGDHTFGSELFWLCEAGGQGVEIKLGMNAWKSCICLQAIQWWYLLQSEQFWLHCTSDYVSNISIISPSNTGADISALQPQMFSVQAAAGWPTACCGLAQVREYLVCCQNYLRSNYARSVSYTGISRGMKEDYCIDFVVMAAGLYCAVIWG